jgi:inosine/xanthosine triphosphate pyrophosphatase family protein
MSRLGLRDVFLRLDRQPRLFFYTTSSEKFAQAQFAFQRSGLSITEFKSRHDPYREDEDGTSRELLTRAIEEICETVQLAASTLFFVEDTSLRVDALSDPTGEVPGLHVKEWFARTSFEELDRELKEAGNVRAATVKSDIALHLPNLGHPLFFHGETSGAVASTPPDFQASIEHPWLRPDSFNGWLIPDDADCPLGAMRVEESWRYDFRAKALTELIGRLEEYAAVLNLPVAASTRRVKRLRALEPTLFSDDRPTFVVIGPTCAGKTTFGNRAAVNSEGREAMLHIEASDIVRTFDGGPKVGESPLDFALRVLGAHGFDVAARRIVDEYYGDQLRAGAVITGFRTIEELLYIRSALSTTRVLYLDAPLRTRYDRFLQRRRSADDTLSLEDFKRLDLDQGSFGLLSAGSQLADVRLVNDQNFETYFEQIEAILAGAPAENIPGFGGTPAGQRADRAQLYRCLQALRSAGRPLSTDEIERWTGEHGGAIRHNNANKILKRYPALARRLDSGGPRLRYDVSTSGLAYLSYVEQYLAPGSAATHTAAHRERPR